jgi:hypothetical protein
VKITPATMAPIASPRPRSVPSFVWLRPRIPTKMAAMEPIGSAASKVAAMAAGARARSGGGGGALCTYGS